MSKASLKVFVSIGASGELSMMNRIRKYSYIFCMIALLIGCTTMPPIANNAEDIASLSADETSIRVRRMEDHDIHALSKYEKLWRLDFAGGWAIEDAPITDLGVEELCKLPLIHLEDLDLGYCYNLTDEALISLGNKKWSKLSLLMLWKLPLITDASIPHLASIESLGALAKMPNLNTLDLRGCTGLTDAGLEALKQLGNIEWLMLGGCTSIDDDDLLNLQQALPNCRLDFSLP